MKHVPNHQPAINCKSLDPTNWHVSALAGMINPISQNQIELHRPQLATQLARLTSNSQGEPTQKETEFPCPVPKNLEEAHPVECGQGGACRPLMSPDLLMNNHCELITDIGQILVCTHDFYSKLAMKIPHRKYLLKHDCH